MGLEGAYGDDEDSGIGSHAGHCALEVDEALQTHVGAETGLGEDVSGTAALSPRLRGTSSGAVSRNEIGQNRRAACGDIPEGPGVDQSGRALAGAQEVGGQSVAQDRGHGTRRAEVLGGHPPTIGVAGDDDASEPIAQIGQGRRQGHDDHDLTGRSDVEG